MKKAVIIFLMCMILGVTVLGQTTAQVYHYDAGETEIFIEHKGLSQEKLDKIVSDFLINEAKIDKSEVSPMSNVLCLFGHSIETSRITYITHYVYTTTPKCKADYYLYEVCTRSGCDYYKYEYLNSSNSYCH